MRPSGEKAGEVTESAKLVICTQSVVGTGKLGRRNSTMNKTATRTTAAALAGYIQFREIFCGWASAVAEDPPESDRASTANAKSDADWKRCSGFFSKQRCTILCSARGMVDASREVPGGSSLRMAFIVSTEVGFRNAR